MGQRSDIHFNTQFWKASPGKTTEQSQEWQDKTGITLVQDCLPVEVQLYHLLDDEMAVRAYYRDEFARQGVGVVQCDLIEVDGLRAIQTIGKIIRQGQPILYIASINIPLKTETFMLALYAQEKGTTGLREAAVATNLQQSQKLVPDPTTGRLHGWQADPYFPEFKGPSLRTMADAEGYDAQFPEHPLSLLRQRLTQLHKGLQLSQEAKDRDAAAPVPELPKKPWWQFWKKS